MFDLLYSVLNLFADGDDSAAEMHSESLDSAEALEPNGSTPSEPTQVRFGWAYPETASSDELILAQDGRGYLYPSDFAAGTNPYEPE